MRTWLIDKSAYVRLASSADAEEWANRIGRGLVQITVATALEIGYSARSGTEWRTMAGSPPLAELPRTYLTPAVEDRAFTLQGVLAQRGHHRAPSVPDLLVAATAEALGLVVLHNDKNFELIAEVTGQPVERLRY